MARRRTPKFSRPMSTLGRTLSRDETGSRPSSRPHGTIRYAVVGLGHIAQVAVLPAFAHARRNSELAALVSDDKTKLRELSRRYHVDAAHSYDDYERCLEQVDAVYIALPNSMHAEYTIRAARAGVHVLCEKPMAVTEDECERMIEACRTHRVKLMVAYRLHFEEINLKAIELVRKGRIGEPPFFQFVVRHVGAAPTTSARRRSWAVARSTTSASTASTPLATSFGPSRSK